MGYAQKEVKMYIDGSYKVKPGEQVVVPVQVKNNFEMVGLQFKVVLPDGVTLVENEDEMYCTTNSSRIPRKYTIGETPLSPTIGNGISFTFESDGSVPIKGESGEICTLTFKVDESAALGNLTVKFADILFQYMDGDIPTDFGDYDNFDLNLQVYETYSISAVSANETMGSVTLTNGGEAVENGTEVTAEATPVEGYSFVNWTSGETEVSKENPYKFTAEANTSLTANFKANMYDVTFDVDGQKTTSSLAFGSVITTPAAPTKTGYTFAGWSPAFKEGDTVPVDGITYTATWTVNQYTITFDTDGGSEVAAITQDYASAVTAPAAPTKTGYTFKGWEPAIPETVPAENLTVKAKWQINQYTITFDTDGGSEIAPITQDYNTEVKAPADPTKTGYTFKGWEPAVPTTIPAENLTVKAQWQINQYTVKFVVDGEELKSETLDYNSAITAPADPVKEGHTFMGWAPSYVEGAKVPANDVTYTAVWKVSQYTITFDTDGGTEVAAITQDYASAVTAPAAPTKTGYTFKGWDKAIPSTIPAENVTIKAQWQINQYTITFDTDGGTEVAAIKQDYASAVTAPAAPTKTGYTFNGWDKDIPATMPAENVTIKALWEINQYTVKFVVDGEELKSETLNYNSAITAPADPVKEGHTFMGWNPSYVEGAKVPANDVTYTAVWKANQYTITFDTDGGTEVAAITQDYASDVTTPAAPTKTGYTFKGWDKEIPATMPAENVTIKAQWQINQYTVKFVADGTVVSETTLDYGTAITAPDAPAKKGYTFTGWSPEVDETVPANDVTYEAEYTINTYKLTYVLDDVTVQTLDVEYGAEIEEFVPEVEDGREFEGWEDVPATMPAHDVTIYGSTTIATFISAHFANSGKSLTVYTLNGTRVMTLEKASDIKRLTRGTYIINGRKVNIRK